MRRIQQLESALVRLESGVVVVLVLVMLLLAVYNVIYRNVDGGANGRWYRPEGITIEGVYHVPFYWPEAIACCGANRAVAVGGDTDEATPAHGEIVLLA